MKDILKEISVLAIQSNRASFTNEHKNLKWLGNDPASIEEIKAAEHQLGVELPEDYKNFLLTTNGFFTPCDSTEPTFEKVDKIDYLINIDDFAIEVWHQDALIEVGKELSRSIVVGGIHDEQYFLLIPPKTINEKWQYWKFANWIPGEEPYEDLETYFANVLDFLRGLDNN